MKKSFLIILCLCLVSMSCKTIVSETKDKPVINFDSLAMTPPMGWNSWDCLGLDANEEQIKAVADYMSENLKKYGWEYVVIDAGWYHPKELITAESRTINPSQNLDQYGRLIPDTIKYPSAKNGIGLKSLADYVHSKGLKIGVHLMRGIPWNAVVHNTPIKGTAYFAGDIADLIDTCSWSSITKGVNMKKPGAQEYYNSVFELFAEWGLDYVKVDDMSFPYHTAEIEAVHNAIINSGAPVIFSLSPGPTPVDQLAHVSKNAHMWRISGDFWDDWKWLKRQFGICNQWDSIHTPGRWPDADMLPIGKLRKTGGDAWIAAQLGSTIAEVTDEYSRFTDTEKYTLFTLYSIFKSPLILGGYLPENDSVTLNIITNEEVIAIDQYSENNHEIRNSNGIVIWTADMPGIEGKYVAIFNTNDVKEDKISVSWKEIEVESDGELFVRDLWAKKDLGKFTSEFNTSVDAHGCMLIRVGE
jgi:alpha-galactosidase